MEKKAMEFIVLEEQCLEIQQASMEEELQELPEYMALAKQCQFMEIRQAAMVPMEAKAAMEEAEL